MADPIQSLLNKIIASLLPKLNGELAGAIKSDNLDPLVNVASGSAGGSAAKASYSLRNLRGLSSLQITKLEITSATADPNDSSKIGGGLLLGASVGRMGVTISGSARALFIKVGLSGEVTISSASVTSTGTFQASTTDGKICLDDIDITTANVDYSGIDIHIDGLGVLNYLLEPLEQAILAILKGTIENTIASNIRPIVNEQADNLLPQCTEL